MQRFTGGVALALVFVTSAAFSWAFFADRSAPSGAQEAAAAQPSVQEPPAHDAYAGVTLKATSAIVVDETANHVLYSLDADTQWPLASLTKVPLALVVSAALPRDTIITVPEGVPNFPAGSHWKLGDFMDYTLTISSNEGADALAEVADTAVHTAYPASDPGNAVIWRMNDLSKTLGLSNTYFLNDNGLDESETQSGAYGSARDMAALFAYAANTAPSVFAATTRKNFDITSEEGLTAFAVNTDELVDEIPGFIMGKTGYTTLAGGNLAIVFSYRGHRLVAVVLGSTEEGRFIDMRALISRTKAALDEGGL